MSRRVRNPGWGTCYVFRDSGRRCRRPADAAYRMRVDDIFAPHYETATRHHDEYVAVPACRPCAERLGFEPPRRSRR